MTVKKASPFAMWTRSPKKGVRLQLPDSGSRTSVITLHRDAGKARDQMAKLMSDAPKAIREAAVDRMSEGGLGETVAKWKLSNKRVDSYDSTLDPAGWELGDFARNPVVLFGHNASALPVGTDQGAYVREAQDGEESGALMGVTRFVSEDLDAFGAKVGKFVKAGVLRAVSVGFEPLDFEVAEDRDDGGMFAPINFIRQALREYSVVPVPSNPDTLLDEARLAGAGLSVRDIADLVEHALEGTGHLFVPKSELLALRRQVRGARIQVDLAGIGSFLLARVDSNIPANQEAYVDEEDQHPAEPDAARAEGDVVPNLICPECGATAPADQFLIEEGIEEDVPAEPAEPADPAAPDEGRGEGEGEMPPADPEAPPEDDDEEEVDLTMISTEALEAEIAARQSLDETPDSRHAQDAEALADLIEDIEMKTTGRLP